jgi:transcriptional regulator with XRE-family HTH domain
MENKIHIGSIIKTKLKERKMSVTDFADALNCCRNNVYKIFNSDNIDINRLVKISKILNYDFLSLYHKQDQIKKRFGSIIKTKLKERKMSVTDFADALNCCRNNVYKIFNSDNIDINRLVKISKILNYDFLSLYHKQDQIKKRFTVEIIDNCLQIINENEIT